MSASLHERAGEIFLQAIELPSDQRRRHLEKACADDTALFAEVSSLLEAADSALPVLDVPARCSAEAFAAADDERFIGQQFGSYTVTRWIASGGMGIVYEAEQENPRRTVALKILRRGLVSRSAVRRFEFEVQALAMLRHPGIGQVHEAGVHVENGARIPYFAMEYIQGGASITEYANRVNLSPSARLQLFVRVCDAVHHGHQKGIIHRDLKPDNVLVDPSGQPKVIDFGVARTTEADMSIATRQTNAGQLIGTLPYMSPEQVAEDPNDVDTRADVYALGVILFELLAKKSPLEMRDRSLIDAVRVIRETEPRKLGSIDKSLRGDLETIVAKALEKEKTRRYQSAAELAADVNRFLGDEPISARPPTAMYQLRKFARRNRGLVRGAVIGVVALVVGTAVAVQQAYHATKARNVAERERNIAQYQGTLASIAAAAAALEDHDVPLARRSLERVPPNFRKWEWHYLAGRLDESLATIPVLPGVSTNGSRFLDDNIVGTWDAQASEWHCWNATTGARLKTQRAPEFLTPSLNGTKGFTLVGSDLAVVTTETGARQTFDLSAFGLRDVMQSVAVNFHVTDDGKYLAANTLSLAYRLNLDSLEISQVGIDSQRIGTAPSALGPTGALAIATGLQGMPTVWMAGQSSLQPLKGVSISGTEVVFNPSGTRIAAVLRDATVRLWDAQTRELLATGRGHTNNASCVVFSPDGAFIATAGRDRTIRLWDAETLELLKVYQGHEDKIVALDFNPSGTLLLSRGAGADNSIRVWDTSSTADAAVLLGHRGYVYPVAVSSDGRLFASGGWDNEVRLWRGADNSFIRVLAAFDSYPTRLQFSPDGRHLLVCTHDRVARIFDIATSEILYETESIGSAHDTTYFPDGKHIYLPSREFGPVHLWNTNSGEVVERPMSALSALRSGPVDTDGRFAVRHDAGSYYVVKIANGLPALPEPIGHIHDFGTGVSQGKLVTIDPSIPIETNVWDLETSAPIGTLRGHSGRAIWDIKFSPDGSRIFTAGDDEVIRVWDSETFDEILQLRGHRSYVWSLAFRNDGTLLISGSGDNTVRVWDATKRHRRGGSGREPQVE